MNCSSSLPAAHRCQLQHWQGADYNCQALWRACSAGWTGSAGDKAEGGVKQDWPVTLVEMCSYSGRGSALQHCLVATLQYVSIRGSTG